MHSAASKEHSTDCEQAAGISASEAIFSLTCFILLFLCAAGFLCWKGAQLLAADILGAAFLLMGLSLGEVFRRLITGRIDADPNKIFSIYKGVACCAVGVAGTIVGVLYYGIACQHVNNPFLKEVISGGPAALAGLQAGDRVLELGGRKFELWSFTYSNLGIDSSEPLLVPVKIKDVNGLERVVDIKLTSTAGELDEMFGITPHNLPTELTPTVLLDRVSNSLQIGLLSVLAQLRSQPAPANYISASSTAFGNRLFVSLSFTWMFGFLISAVWAVRLAFGCLAGLVAKSAAIAEKVAERNPEQNPGQNPGQA